VTSGHCLTTEAFRHALIGMAVTSSDGTLLQVNDALRRFLGRDEATLLSTREQELTAPEDRGLSAGAGEPLVKRYQRADGTTVWARVTCQPTGADPTRLLLQCESLDELVGLREQLRESRIRLRSVLGSAPVTLFVVDTEGRVLQTEGAVLTAFERLRGAGVNLFAAYEHAPRFVANVRRALRGETLRITQEVGGRVYDIRFCPLRDDAVAQPDERGADAEITAMMGVATDVTEETRIAEEQRIRTARQAAVAGLGQEALDGLELDQVLNRAAGEVAAWLDVPLSAVLELPPGGRRLHLRAGVGWREGLVGRAALGLAPGSPAGAVLASGEPVAIEDLRADPRWSPDRVLGDHGVVAVACVMIGHPDQAIGVLAVYARTRRRFPNHELQFLQTMANVVGGATQRRRAEEAALHRALHDPLTGLANRTLFLDHLRVALARAQRHRRSIGVLFVDLDRFKAVNDFLGHDAGNRLLRVLAERLQQGVRPGDTIARLAGDEFAVLCEELDGEREAGVVAQRLLRALAEPVPLDGRDVAVTASIGIALGRSADDADRLLRDADTAMYGAKRRGKARFELFDPAMRARAHDRLELENDLRRAIGMGELRLAYQPVLSVGGRRVLGVEALVRWQHPRRGLLPPGAFVSLAEETGLIMPLGEWVLRESLAQLRHALPANRPDRIRLSVNVSARQLNEAAFPEVVAAAAEQAEATPVDLCLEITESALMEDDEASATRLRELKDLGVTVSVDDFGTGYSSLRRLRQLPIDTLKIDRSFVSGLERDGEDSAIVSAVVRLAHAMGLETVAEGVETAEQLRRLHALGCDLVQGFFLCRPQPVDALELDALG
jgi:diguanylate cyclase (GGDEF)-like protein